jgi:hypothetical protein
VLLLRDVDDTVDKPELPQRRLEIPCERVLIQANSAHEPGTVAETERTNRKRMGGNAHASYRIVKLPPQNSVQ